MTTTDFFETLWPDDLPGVFYLSTIAELKSGKKQVLSYWFDNIKGAADYIPKLNGADIYYGIGLAKQKPAGSESDRQHHRCTKKNVAAIPALWADVDVDKEGSKKKYFPTREAARDFLNGLPLKPSMLVWSGGGYHAYWLFNEPAAITSPRERSQVTALSKGWQDYLRQVAKKDGIAIDSTHNIDRIFRVVGTVNHKWGVDVEVEYCDDTRYNPYDFDDYVKIPASLIAPSASSLHVLPRNGRDVDLSIGTELPPDKILRKDIIYDFKNAQPPAEKFSALREIEPRFDASWNRSRRLKDESASGYDLSLASLAAHAGWTDQEIVNLIIANRRKFNDMGKLMRRDEYFFHPSYGVITVAAASVAEREALLEMQDIEEEIVRENVVKLAEQAASADPEASTEEKEKLAARAASAYEQAQRDRQRRLDKVVKYTSVPIKRIIKYGLRQNGRYVVEMENGVRESMGEIEEFRNMEKWVNLSCVHGTKIMQPIKKSVWLKTPFAIINSLVEPVDMEEMNDESITLQWARSFAEFAPNYKFLETQDVEDSGAFIYKELVWIQVAALLRDVSMKGGGRYTHGKMVERLKNAGFVRQSFTHYSKDRTTRKCRSYFVYDWKMLMGQTVAAIQPVKEDNDE